MLSSAPWRSRGKVGGTARWGEGSKEARRRRRRCSALPSAAPMMMTTTVVVMVVAMVEGGRREREREREDAREAKGESCPAWTCASLHGRPGDSLSAR